MSRRALILVRYLALLLLVPATLYWGFDMKQIIRDLIPSTLGVLCIVAVLDISRPPSGR